MVTTRSSLRSLRRAPWARPHHLALAAFLFLGACGGGSSTGAASAAGNIDLLRVVAGRLVDVYGLRESTAGKKIIELFEKDVVIGPEIQDERDGNSRKRDEEIRYDFIGVDPDNLQAKLLITRVIGTKEFQGLYDALDDGALSISSAAFGQDTKLQPFTVAPRNGGFRLDFNKDLGLSEDFFLTKDDAGRVIGIKNPEAVQLLEILGDPRDNDPTGDFRFINTRIAYKGDHIVLDPVLLGGEGQTFNVPNTAKGLPESPNSVGANIRLALAIEGPLQIRGLRARGASNNLIGTNLNGRKSIIRDFRSGNAKDSNKFIANGYARDATPPRLVGEMSMRLERVEIRGDEHRVFLYKAGIKHEVDRGDTLKLFTVNSNGKPVATTEVIVDPEDDLNNAGQQYVMCIVRDATPWVALDPSKSKDFPPGRGKDNQAWLTKNAPVIVLATDFNGEKDDPLNFITFTPKPIPHPDYDPEKDPVPPANENVSPHASAIVRFTKPVDLNTVRPFDSLILATLGDTVELLDAKKGTPHLVFSQVFDEDGSQTALRTAPPLGFYLDDEMRKTGNEKKFPYYLHLIGGLSGIRDLAGQSIDFQFLNKSREFVSFPFFIDVNNTRTGNSGPPRFANNRVVTVARRFLDKDEDEDTRGALDAFGAIVYQDGRISGRPTSRLSAFVDDRNQLPSPPAPPLAYCPAGQTATLTGATPFGQPIQNPLNPLGCRLQTQWREIDLSLSRTNPFDFNLDFEGMWWAPFQATQSAPKTEFDVFDRLSLFVGHSERRPSPCVTIPGSLPAYTGSGLWRQFYHNFLRSLKKTASGTFDLSGIDERPKPHIAFKDVSLTIRNEDSVFEPSGINRFLPLPKFQKPLLVWRDERITVLGGGRGEARVLSPFKAQFGTFWDNARWTPFQDDGQVGTIALPLLVDFWVYQDDPDLPKDDPFRATGFNGWQISLTVQSSPLPYWRAYSGGGRVGTSDRPVDPSKETIAQGGWNPNTGGRTPWGDNSCYWGCFDFAKRISVMTSGFLNLEDPHNDADHKYKDPRLGPYTWTGGELPSFEVTFDPPLSSLPVGTELLAEYRGADRLRSGGVSVPLDPLIAGNAHVRSYSTASRDWQTYEHTNNLTKYVSDPNDLYDPDWLSQFTSNGQPLRPNEVKLLNWRFIMKNNVNVEPPAAPSLDSFALTYRLEKTN